LKEQLHWYLQGTFAGILRLAGTGRAALDPWRGFGYKAAMQMLQVIAARITGPAG
jgi:hypothetical protein